MAPTKCLTSATKLEELGFPGPCERRTRPRTLAYFLLSTTAQVSRCQLSTLQGKPACRCSSLLLTNRLGLDRTDISRDVGRGCGPRRSTSPKNTPTAKYAECWPNTGRSRCVLPPQPYKETSLCCLHSARAVPSLPKPAAFCFAAPPIHVTNSSLCAPSFQARSGCWRSGGRISIPVAPVV